VLKSDRQLYERVCRFYEILRFLYLTLSYKYKVKFTLEQFMNAQRGSRVISTRSLTSQLGGDGWSTPRPSRFTPWKETRYPLYGRLGGYQCWSGWVLKIWSPTGIRSLDCPACKESVFRVRCPGPRRLTLMSKTNRDLSPRLRYIYVLRQEVSFTCRVFLY
jgi:hypothetical protein